MAGRNGVEEEDARAVRSPNGYYPNSIPPPYRAVALIANSRPSVLPRLRATCSGRRCGLAGWLAGWLSVSGAPAWSHNFMQMIPSSGP